jgi:ParB/RepB/Spo0J family partition protein
MNTQTLTKRVDSFLDELRESDQKDKIVEIMTILGGNYESDLDELFESATEEQLQRALDLKEVEINKTKRSDVLFIDPKLIRIEKGFNTRFDYGDLDELTLSIIENGVRVPLRGYKEGNFYIINDGHRRFLAVNRALKQGIDIARVPFLSEKKKSLEERIFDIILFNDGKSLTPLELGETYRKLITYGYNYSEIAKKIGRTSKHISDMVSVAESSKELKELIKDGGISASLVAEVKSKVKNDIEAEEIIRTVSSIKKESSNGDKKKEKVTKKDVEDLLPEKDLTKVYQDESQKYTEEEVKELLKRQIRACAQQVPMAFRIKIIQTKLVIE